MGQDTHIMFMIAPPAARTRFADWPFAVKSILGFWFFYALTVVARLLSSVVRSAIGSVAVPGARLPLTADDPCLHACRASQ